MGLNGPIFLLIVGNGGLSDYLLHLIPESFLRRQPMPAQLAFFACPGLDLDLDLMFLFVLSQRRKAATAAWVVLGRYATHGASQALLSAYLCRRSTAVYAATPDISILQLCDQVVIITFSMLSIDTKRRGGVLRKSWVNARYGLPAWMKGNGNGNGRLLCPSHPR